MSNTVHLSQEGVLKEGNATVLNLGNSEDERIAKLNKIVCSQTRNISNKIKNNMAQKSKNNNIKMEAKAVVE